MNTLMNYTETSRCMKPDYTGELVKTKADVITPDNDIQVDLITKGNVYEIDLYADTIKV
ncbi:hypothetical protein ACFSJY_19260 [Thalassotalea euphylliae]|uniref:hypothetical protein n=1 Tax=Thalassotalea euphylliae TaxID=1655234 RepID=UPI00363218E8